jgi:hypothetical protein
MADGSGFRRREVGLKTGGRRRLLLDGAAAAALVGLAATVSVAWAHPATRPLARFCCWYSPARLASGAFWTLPGSALLLPFFNMVGPTTVMTAALFLPCALIAGARRAWGAFFTGHVVATLVVAAVVLPGARWNWLPAVVLRDRSDLGASAGLAAAAGALAVRLGWRRGGLVAGTVAAYFGTHLLLTHRLSDVQHLVALTAGAAFERWAEGRQPLRRRGVPHPPEMPHPAACLP